MGFVIYMANPAKYYCFMYTAFYGGGLLLNILKDILGV